MILRNNEVTEHTVFYYNFKEWGNKYYPGIEFVVNIHRINMCHVRRNRLCDSISNCKDHLKFKWYDIL